MLFDGDTEIDKILRKVIMSNLIFNFGRSRSQMFYKIGVFINFVKFTGKHLYQGLFLNKVAGFQLCTSASVSFFLTTLLFRRFDNL